jgi:hypothetical protein
LKVRGVQREESKIKKCSISSKAYFSFCYFFITPFPMHFKDDF